uniref:Uncharacterized protein n=1 Tax=Timema douglasi TaxID=61478 RepID=A0A7R8VX57_TIMDO|nr:unnamed protein product [Timema douglasi]
MVINKGALLTPLSARTLGCQSPYIMFFMNIFLQRKRRPPPVYKRTRGQLNRMVSIGVFNLMAV